MKVYLAGPMMGCEDKDCRVWRDKVTESLPNIEFLNPMARDYRFKEISDQDMIDIVEGDKADIRAVDIVLANPHIPSAGTSMEIHYAFEIGKIVISIGDKQEMSPWVRYHSHHLVEDIDEAIEFLKTFKLQGQVIEEDLL